MCKHCGLKMQTFGQYANLEQNLTLAPQMRQSLKVLQAGSLELRRMANAELQSNPLLEEVPPELPEVSLEDPAPREGDGVARDRFFESIPQRESFQESLRTQAALELRDGAVLRAFNFLADLLDERGFLPPEAFKEAEAAGIPPADASAAAEFMRSCDPPGVGASDFRECFMIQLKRRGRENSLAYAVLESFYPLLQKRRVPEIARGLMVSEGDVERAIAEISTLDMSPAKTFSDDGARAVSADLRYFKRGGAWDVELTNEYVPRLRINNAYREMIARGGLSREDVSYMKGRMRDARDIIDAVEQRQRTLLAIGRAILAGQPEFFVRGRDFLKPMTMAEIAEVVGVHPTTVSRAVSEKYAQIGYSFVPLKFFFAGGYSTGGDGGGVASTSVKSEIGAIIGGEPPSRPYSDGEIAEMLKARNIDIARRTVAKYREELGIPAKSLRRRFS